MAVGTGMKLAHAIAIDQVKNAVLPGGREQSRMGARLIGQENGAAGSEIVIFPVEAGLVEWREIVKNPQRPVLEAQLQYRVSIVAAAGAGGELAVSGNGVDGARVVGGKAGIGLPDAAFSRVRRRIEDAGLLQAAGIVGQHPAVVRT